MLYLVIIAIFLAIGLLIALKAMMYRAPVNDCNSPALDPEDLPNDLPSAAEVAMNPPNLPEMKLDIWVVPFKTELDKKVRWAVQEEKDGAPLTLATTQAEAEKEGRRLAKENKVNLVVLGRGSALRKRSSYDSKK